MNVLKPPKDIPNNSNSMNTTTSKQQQMKNKMLGSTSTTALPVLNSRSETHSPSSKY